MLISCTDVISKSLNVPFLVMDNINGSTYIGTTHPAIIRDLDNVQNERQLISCVYYIML